MSARQWKRDQKYHPRPRHLYALLFENGCAYIGQTVNLRQREQQHRRPAGGWGGKAFQCVHLGTVEDTEAVAVDFEHAWRHVAAQAGWRIYAKPPGVVVNHRRQMTPQHYALARSLRWPSSHSRSMLGAARSWSAWRWMGLGLVLLVLPPLVLALLWLLASVLAMSS